MAKTKKEKPLTITLPDGKEYNVEEMNDQNKMLSHHMFDLDNKINNLRFSLDQMMMGFEMAQNKLIEGLEEAEKEDGQPKDE